MDITIPAPVMGGTDPAASPVTTPVPEQSPPQATEPAGNDEQQKTASDEGPSQDNDPDKPKTWKEKRQERNRERWREFKAAKDVIPHRLQAMERELAQLRSQQAPDFSKIADPIEESAKRAAWEVRQQLADEKQGAIKTAREQAYAEQRDRMLSAWQESVEEARERIPDFDAVVNDKTHIHERAAPYIVESEKGTDIAYWLGKNSKAAAELYQQFETAPGKALVELGRIEARLSAPQAKTLSTAPKPAQTLNGGVNPLQFDAARASVSDMADQLRKSGLIR